MLQKKKNHIPACERAIKDLQGKYFNNGDISNVPFLGEILQNYTKNPSESREKLTKEITRCFRAVLTSKTFREEYASLVYRYSKQHFLDSPSWTEFVDKEVYVNPAESASAFIRVVEEEIGRKLSNGLDLWKNSVGKEKAETDSRDGCKQIYFAGRQYDYFQILEDAIGFGAKYQDLLKIIPQNYNLPATWTDPVENIRMDQEKSIRQAIYNYFYGGFPSEKEPQIAYVAEVLDVQDDKLFFLKKDKERLLKRLL